MASSESVHLLDPSGQVVETPADGADSLLSLGYRPATQQQIEEFKTADAYGSTGQQVIAGAEGLARGLSARLSTAAEVAAGVDPKDIAGRMETHPATANISEGVGIALPLLATLGAAAPVEAVGQTALRGAAELAAPALISRAGAAVGGRVVGGAIEGALYGAGNVVHEAALGDPDLSAQSVIAQVGLSAAMGGALGGLVDAGIKGIRAAAGKARGAVEGLAELAEGLATPEKLKALAQDSHDSINEALHLANKSIRPSEIASTLTTAPEAAQGELVRVTDRLGEVATNMRSQPELFPQAMYPAKLEQIREMLLRNGVEGLPAEEVYTALNEAKQTIDKQIGKWGRLISPEQQDAVAAIRGVRTEIKHSLENEAIWGETGARQAAFNDAQADFLEAQKDFRKEFMIKKPGRGVQPDFEIDAGKVHRLSDTGNPRQPIRQEIWDTYQSASKRLLDEIDKSAMHAPTSGFDKDALVGLINKSGEMEQANRQQGTILRMLGRMGGVGPMGTMAGGIVGGPVGAAIGAGIDVIAKGAKYIPKAVDTLSRLHANNEAVTQAIGAAAAKLASGGTKAARVGREEVVAGIARSFGMDADEASAHFDKHADKIRSMTANPEVLQSTLESQTADIHEHAPQTAQAMQIASARAMSFLASKLPPQIKPGPLSQPLPMTQHEISVFNRYREAVEKPMSLLKQAQAGTLTPEAVEAVRAVYPQLFQQIQAAVIGKLSEAKEVPYRTRLMASMIMGQDLDGTMNPQAILSAQMIQQPPPPRGQPGKPSAAKAGKLHIQDRIQTAAQKAVGGEK